MKLSVATCAAGTVYPRFPERLEAFKSSRFKHFDLGIPSFVSNENSDKFYADYISNVKNTAEKYGYDFTMAHCPYTFNPHESEENFQKQVKDAEYAIKACSELNIDRMTVHAGFSFCDNKDEMFEKNVRYYSAILPTAEKYGVHLMIENISEKIYKRQFVIETADDILHLRELLDNHELIRACWDTGHANVNALDQYENIIKLKDVLFGVHIQDNNGYNDDHMVPLLGNINFDDVIKGLKDISYNGPFNLESEIFRSGKEWPNYRRPFNENSGSEHYLFAPNEYLAAYGMNFMYDIASYMLGRYNIPVE